MKNQKLTQPKPLEVIKTVKKFEARGGDYYRTTFHVALSEVKPELISEL